MQNPLAIQLIPFAFKNFFYNTKMLLKRIKHVNYNLRFLLTMNQSYQTGLKLKNSLTNELVNCIFIPGIVHSPQREKHYLVHMWPNSILQQSYGPCQKLCLQWYDQKNSAKPFRIQCDCKHHNYLVWNECYWCRWQDHKEF